MTPSWHILVVVPARDEAGTAGRTIRSIRHAAGKVAPRATTDIVVVADSCTDDTEARSRRALGSSGVVVASTVGSAGAARRFGVEVGLRRSPGPANRTWIANTDADTSVPPSWLLTQLRLGLDGALGVAGIVRLQAGADRTPAMLRAFSSAYEIHPDGQHPHVHGANLGFRADAYLAVGGWADLATGEDHDLWRRLRARHPVISSSDSFVNTSSRRAGRAPAGFANDLARLDATLSESA